jgi:hypothetical protein
MLFHYCTIAQFLISPFHPSQPGKNIRAIPTAMIGVEARIQWLAFPNLVFVLSTAYIHVSRHPAA